MNAFKYTAVVLALGLLVGWSFKTSNPHEISITKLDFERDQTGKSPAGWKITATRPTAKLATWQVVEDRSAPAGKKVLSLTKVNHNSGRTFNLCLITNTLQFCNGEITVHLKANTGRIDQGGGIAWRVLDANNYYVARFNPLEDNFRLYYVKDGRRRMIADAQAHLPPKKWITMKICQHGNKIEGWLNGKKLIEATDTTFTKTGGIGLWTKADAATAFDNLQITSESSK